MAEAVLETPKWHRCPAFVRELVKVWRAQDTHGTWDAKSDAELLEPLYRRQGSASALPIVRDPDPETILAARTVLQRHLLGDREATGVMISPMLKMHHEGFGRMVLIGGRLIVVNKQLRDVHRFGLTIL